jgi:hypothetical protein
MKIWHGTREVPPCRFGGPVEAVDVGGVPRADFTVVRVKISVRALKCSPEVNRPNQTPHMKYNMRYVMRIVKST